MNFHIFNFIGTGIVMNLKDLLVGESAVRPCSIGRPYLGFKDLCKKVSERQRGHFAHSHQQCGSVSVARFKEGKYHHCNGWLSLRQLHNLGWCSLAEQGKTFELCTGTQGRVSSF